MAIFLRTLQGSEIPERLRKPGRHVLYEVEASDGTRTYVESGLDAAALAARLHRDEGDDDEG